MLFGKTCGGDRRNVYILNKQPAKYYKLADSKHYFKNNPKDPVQMGIKSDEEPNYFNTLDDDLEWKAIEGLFGVGVATILLTTALMYMRVKTS